MMAQVAGDAIHDFPARGGESIGLPSALQPLCAGSCKGLKCLRQNDGRGGRARRSPTRKRCCSTARAARASSRSSPPSRWRRSATCRWPIRRASPCRCWRSPRTRTRAYDYTSKGNLVAVISNGTAILGLGNLGALAAKPVMEGKAVLFKRFADVDSIDLEVVVRGPRRDHQLRQAPRPDLRRHQPRGHQGAGVLHHRAAAARAARHPGVPRRPARHRDHRRRRPDQRLDLTGRDIKTTKLVLQRRRRRRHRLPRADQGDGRHARERHPLRHQGRDLPGPHRGHEPVEVGARGRRPRRARWPRR